MEFQMKRKLSRSWVVLVLLAAFMLAACGTPDDKKTAFFLKGNSLFDAGDFVKARLEFKNAVQIDPEFAKGYYMLGKTELKLKNGKAAYSQISRAVSLDPELMDARLDLGKIFLAGRAFDRAGAQAEEILKRDPGNRDAKFLKASVYLAGKKVTQAGELLDTMAGNGEEEVEFYLLRASCHKAAGEDNMAEAVLLKGLEAHPDELALVMSLARFYGQEGDLKQVETFLVRALEISPETIGLKLNLAWLYLTTQKQAQAQILLDQILAADPENEKTTLAVAALLIKSGELDQSIEIVKQGIEKSPANYPYFALLSEIHLKKKEIKRSEDVLRDFLTLEDQAALPDMIRAKVNLAKLLLLQKRAAEAKPLIDQVLVDDPKNIDAHYLKGRMYLVSGDGPGAVSNFRTVTSEHPEHLEGYIGLANAHVINQDYDLALDVLKNALKRAPDSDKILQAMVRVNILKKDSRATEENLKQLISLDPYNLGAIAGLGDFYLSQNRYEDAIAQYQLIKSQKKGESLGYLKTAQALAKQDRMDKAIDELETGSEKAANSAVFISSLAQLYLRQGKRQEAIEKFRESLAIDPKNKFAWLTLANIYEANQENEKAIEVYRQSLVHYPDSWTAANNLAFLLSELGDSKASLDEAMVFARKADELNPGSPLVQDTLGWIYYKKGELTKAEEKVSLAIEKMPDNEAICYHLGAISHDLGKRTEAGINLKKALAGTNDFLGRQHAAELYEKYYQ